MLTASSRWDDALLEPMRAITDPLADELVGDIFSRGQLEEFNALMTTLTQNETELPKALSSRARDFLRVSEQVPGWADTAQLALAQDLFAQLSAQISIVLLCASLPEGFAAAKVSRQLAITKTFHAPEQRVVETAQFVFDVLSPGAFGRQGCAVRSIQKVRLIHAAVRYHVRRRKEWSPALGEPVNQEDMVGTIMGFSIIVLDGLRRLGIRLSPREEAAFMHLWCVVGAMSGVSRELLPHSPEDARALMAAGRRRHHAPSEEGRWLATKLIAFLERQMPSAHVRGLPRALVRYLVGPKVARILDLDQVDWTQQLVHPVRLGAKLLYPANRHVPFLRPISMKLSQDALHAMCKSVPALHGRFKLPPAMRSEWRLGTQSRHHARHRALANTAVTMLLVGQETKHTASLVDVSARGARLQLACPPDGCTVGSEVEVELQQAGLEPLRLTGRIRHRIEHGASLQIGIDLAADASVSQLLLRYARSQPSPRPGTNADGLGS